MLVGSDNKSEASGAPYQPRRISRRVESGRKSAELVAVVALVEAQGLTSTVR